MKYTDLMENLDEMLHKNDYFRFWWIPHTENCVIWRANKTSKPLQPLKATVHPFYSITFYQYLLSKSLANTKLLPFINRFYHHLLFRSPKYYIDTPENALTFNCLFP